MADYQIVENLPESIFRAYDIRGVVGDTFNENVAYTIGLSLGSEAQELGVNQMVVGRDGRISGPSILAALQAGILASGTDVINVGEVPTPVLYFATHHLGTMSGVMVTGSHNPKDYNGFKMILAGQTLFAERIKAIYDRALVQNFTQGEGEVREEEIISHYIERITSDVTLSRPMKIVVDCGNGVPGGMVPQLFRALGCEVTELFCEVDGNFPNHHPDPSVKENMQDLIKEVCESGADIGLGFDGDGDRLGVICNEGSMIFPDRQLMLFAIDVLSRQPGAPIIFDVKCSQNLATVIQEHQGRPIMWKTGHSYIKTKMAEMDSPLSGEMSGHIFFKERWYGFDDAMYAGVRLLEILSKDKRPCNEVFLDLPDSVNTPEIKMPVPDSEKFDFISNFVEQASFADAELITIDGLRVNFDFGWGLIRASNTTPCLTFRFEAGTEEGLEKVQALFRDQLMAYDKNLEIPF